MDTKTLARGLMNLWNGAQGFRTSMGQRQQKMDEENLNRNTEDYVRGGLDPQKAKNVAGFQQQLMHTAVGATMGGDMSQVMGKAGTIGAMQQATQAPDLTLYEQALNKMDIPAMTALAAKHIGDARFLVHKTLLGG